MSKYLLFVMHFIVAKHILPVCVYNSFEVSCLCSCPLDCIPKRSCKRVMYTGISASCYLETIEVNSGCKGGEGEFIENEKIYQL